ncbi:hypothetical protein H1C71_007728 [Ictidomys tridecemlineatus]|nr:hypothetical protein H1C71_007728 [Ictidomys tridecemlineatus]
MSGTCFLICMTGQASASLSLGFAICPVGAELSQLGRATAWAAHAILRTGAWFLPGRVAWHSGLQLSLVFGPLLSHEPLGLASTQEVLCWPPREVYPREPDPAISVQKPLLGLVWILDLPRAALVGGGVASATMGGHAPGPAGSRSEFVGEESRGAGGVGEPVPVQVWGSQMWGRCCRSWEELGLGFLPHLACQVFCWGLGLVSSDSPAEGRHPVSMLPRERKPTGLSGPHLRASACSHSCWDSSSLAGSRERQVKWPGSWCPGQGAGGPARSAPVPTLLALQAGPTIWPPSPPLSCG